MSALSRTLAPLLFVLAVASCGPSVEKREAQLVAVAIDRLRQATGPQRVVELEALITMKLTSPAAKKAQTECHGAYKLLHDATAMIESLEEQRKQGLLAMAALEELKTANAMLAKAKVAGQDCAKAMQPLQSRLR